MGQPILSNWAGRSVALRVLSCLIVSLLFLTVACGGGGKDVVDRTPTAPPDAAAIRGFDFGQNDQTQAMISQLGSGGVEPQAILYADLTGDQREEAIVPVTSQGTLGNVGYLVFTMDSGKPKVILTRTIDRTSASGLQMSIQDGALVETRGVYGSDDPLCCPSQLRVTTFQWDGSQLQVEKEELQQQDPGPKR